MKKSIFLILLLILSFNYVDACSPLPNGYVPEYREAQGLFLRTGGFDVVYTNQSDFTLVKSYGDDASCRSYLYIRTAPVLILIIVVVGLIIFLFKLFKRRKQ